MPTYKVLIRRLAAAAICLFLSSCGGGNTEPTISAMPFVAAMRVQALASPVANAGTSSSTSATANAAVTADMVLDWAEFKLPELFPKAIAQKFPAVVFQGNTYNARAYVGAWGTRYLGITADGRVFGLGDFTGNALRGYETVAFWAPQVAADRCLVDAASCAAADAPTLTANASNSALVQRSGDVLVWGENTAGVMLGSGAPIVGSAARRLSLDATSVSAGLFHFVAVRRDGTVVGWGRDVNGALGDSNSFGVRLVPSPQVLPGLTAVRAAVASATTSGGMTTVLRDDGTVWHLPGTTTPTVPAGGFTSTPRQIEGLSGVQSLFGVYNASSDRPLQVVALKADGSVVEIDYIESRALFNTTFMAIVTPVVGLGPVRSVSCSTRHCLYLLRDGRVFASGSNTRGELGNGSTANSPGVPVQVIGLSQVRSVAASMFVSAAVGEDGRLWTWGSFQGSGRANAGGVDATAPVLVSGVNDAVEVTAGLSHFLFRRSDGTVWGWGENGRGQLGGGEREAGVPQQVPGVRRD